MKILMSSCLVVAWSSVVFMFGMTAPHNVTQEQPKVADIQGYYELNGKDSAGNLYSGVVTVEKVKDIYVVHWSVGSPVKGYSTTIGVGQRDGERLSVGWKVDDGKGFGCTVYIIAGTKEVPTLTGHYAAIPGKGELLPETLIFLRKLAKPVKGDI